VNVEEGNKRGRREMRRSRKKQRRRA